MNTLLFDDEDRLTETCLRLLGCGLLQEVFHLEKWPGAKREGAALVRKLEKSLPFWTDRYVIDSTQFAPESEPVPFTIKIQQRPLGEEKRRR